MAREVAGWITAFGRHIPIYTDDPNLSSYQEMWDKAETKTSTNSNGGAGEYTVYRAGDLSGASTGMVYFATDKEKAEQYAKPNSFKMQGKTYKTPRREVNEYSFNIKNPLIVEGDDDTTCAKRLYSKLYPGKDFKEEAKKQGKRITGLNSQMLYLDKANGEALRNTDYDCIQYKTYNSKTGSRTLSQIIIPADSELLKRR